MIIWKHLYNTKLIKILYLLESIKMDSPKPGRGHNPVNPHQGGLTMIWQCQ